MEKRQRSFPAPTDTCDPMTPSQAPPWLTHLPLTATPVPLQPRQHHTWASLSIWKNLPSSTLCLCYLPLILSSLLHPERCFPHTAQPPGQQLRVQSRPGGARSGAVGLTKLPRLCVWSSEKPLVVSAELFPHGR